MGYRSALEAAGAKVLAYESFGSYQGDWYAKVEYNGETGWVQGSYGSCSYCDSFESEFSGSYYSDEESRDDYDARLAKFGESYLTVITPQEQQVEILERQSEGNSWFDSEYGEILRYVKVHE